MKLQFMECEHYGDTQSCEQDLISSGARIVNTELDYDNEYAIIEFELNIEASEFLTKFKKTDSYDLTNLE